jgi:hypothetical protein
MKVPASDRDYYSNSDSHETYTTKGEIQDTTNPFHHRGGKPMRDIIVGHGKSTALNELSSGGAKVTNKPSTESGARPAHAGFNTKTEGVAPNNEEAAKW